MRTMDFDRINWAICDFCTDIIREPLLFFSESDLKCLLFQYLSEKVPDKHMTSYDRGANSKSKYRTTQIHTEYGLNLDSAYRVDLVLFDDKKIISIDSPNLTSNSKYLEPDIGIELGTHKIVDFRTHLKNDIYKLSNINKGYLIYMLREETKSIPTSKIGGSTLSWIDDNITCMIQKQSIPDNIIPLIFLIRIQKKSKIWGKCSYFDFQKNDWEYLPLDTLNETIRKITMHNTRS